MKTTIKQQHLTQVTDTRQLPITIFRRLMLRRLDASAGSFPEELSRRNEDRTRESGGNGAEIKVDRLTTTS